MRAPSHTAEPAARPGATGARARLHWTDWAQGHPRAARWALGALVFAVGLTLIPPRAEQRSSTYRVNTAASGTVVARFDFPILKDAELLRAEQEAAVAAAPPVLARADSVAVRAFGDLETLRRTILDLRRNRLERRTSATGATPLSQDTYLALFTLDGEEIFRRAGEELRVLYERGILSATLAERLLDQRHVAIAGAGHERVSPTDLLAVEGRAGHAPPDADHAGAAVAELVRLFGRSNLVLDEEATEQRRQLARDAVAAHIGTVSRGDTLVAVREVINGATLQKLESYAQARRLQSPRVLLRERAISFAGRALILALALVAMALYLFSYRPALMASLGDVLFLALAFGLCFLAGGLGVNVFHLSPYLIPIAAFAVVLALLYDEGLGLVAGTALAATVGLVLDCGLDFIVVLGLGSIAAVLSVRQLRDRRQLYRLLLFVPLVHLAARGALAMAHGAPFAQTMNDVLYLVANPFIAAGIGLFAVPLSESLFGQCTNLTLLELLDLNRPLLRRLMLETPGTYHHSLMVGTLAEAGASAIGANPLLARVIGYHHDIGKIRKPEYFIENLMVGGRNPHDKLAPAMSRLILESHVRDGLALAREFRLPRAVCDGIAQHHGTGLMIYFYNKALKKDPSVSPTEYSYPGPRPRSREVAIVLLADQIEASARTLEDPTPSRLRGLVKQLIERRAVEGELDDSLLTLKDLADLREAFIPILQGLFHGRIGYPTTEAPRVKGSARAGAEPAAKGEG